MKKALIYILIFSMLAVTLAGCSSEKAQTEASPIRLAALTGPTAIGMAKIFRDTDEGTADVAYSTQLFGTADEIVPLILQGNIDIASIPLNLASVLYNKTEGGAVLLAADVLGVLYIGEFNGSTVNSLADLKGQTIYATGKGAVPEIFLRYILTENGIDPDTDLTIEWKSEPGEIIALLNAKQSGIAMLPQPYATAAKVQLGEGYRTVFSLSEEWDALGTPGRCITAGVIVRREFLQENPQLVAAFLQDLEESVLWANDDPADAAAVCEKLGFAKAAVIEKAIPQCNLVCITGEEMQEAVSQCLTVQFDFSPAMVGGALPGDDFYYITEEN